MSTSAALKKEKGGSITVHNSELYSELIKSDPEKHEKVETSQVKVRISAVIFISILLCLELFRNPNCISSSLLWLLTN